MDTPEVGYKAWKIDWSEGTPKLKSVGSGYEWAPGENISSLGPDEDLKGTSRGFYSKKSIKDLNDEGYISTGSIVGKFKPKGKILSLGNEIRSEKGNIDSLFVSGNLCQICGKEEGSYLLPEGIIVGNNCYRRIKKAFGGREPAIGTVPRDVYINVLRGIADKYGVQLEEMPPEENW